MKNLILLILFISVTQASFAQGTLYDGLSRDSFLKDEKFTEELSVSDLQTLPAVTTIHRTFFCNIGLGNGLWEIKNEEGTKLKYSNPYSQVNVDSACHYKRIGLRFLVNQGSFEIKDTDNSSSSYIKIIAGGLDYIVYTFRNDGYITLGVAQNDITIEKYAAGTSKDRMISKNSYRERSIYLSGSYLISKNAYLSLVYDKILSAKNGPQSSISLVIGIYVGYDIGSLLN